MPASSSGDHERSTGVVNDFVPIPVLDARQAAEWDAWSIERGVPSRVLMESAGRAAAVVIAREFGAKLSGGIVVAAGHGNNGGDGWVVARALGAHGVPVWVAEPGGGGEGVERSPDCEANRTLALEGSVESLGPDDDWPRAALVVDALLGTGAAGSPRGKIGAMAARIANHGMPVAAIDGPTGLDLTTGEAHGPVRADLTVTFGGLRRGHVLAREWCGSVVVVEMGFVPLPSRTEWPGFVDDRWVAARLPRFRASMHKGDRGRVLIVGGQNGMAGAARHAARAAFAAGAGLVKVAAQAESVAALQETLPDAMSVATALGAEVEAELGAALAWADAVVLGPGLGRGAERAAFVERVLAASAGSGDSNRPVFVIDADALHTGRDAWGAGSAPRVLTPHLGEFKAAFPDALDLVAGDRFAATAAASEARGDGPADPSPPPITVLLKGVPTIVASSGRRMAVTASGNPALATGGSGDLLAGFIATFLAQGLDPHDAAAMGAHVLGRAAEIASADSSVRSTRPDDVLAAVPDLWHEMDAAPLLDPPILLRLDPPAVV